jgi:hypothetical protein
MARLSGDHKPPLKALQSMRGSAVFSTNRAGPYAKKYPKRTAPLNANEQSTVNAFKTMVQWMKDEEPLHLQAIHQMADWSGMYWRDLLMLAYCGKLIGCSGPDIINYDPDWWYYRKGIYSEGPPTPFPIIGVKP